MNPIPTYPVWREGAYSITADPAHIDLEASIRLIQMTDWAKNRPSEVVARSVQNSLTIGILHQSGQDARRANAGKSDATSFGSQIGVARLVTDYAVFAYLCDVFVHPDHRGKGLSKRLLEFMHTHPGLETIRRWSLLTVNAHGLYRRFGYENLAEPKKYMEIFHPLDYRTPADTTTT
jgi:GNAT superfamily N-acetyltransferase